MSFLYALDLKTMNQPKEKLILNKLRQNSLEIGIFFLGVFSLLFVDALRPVILEHKPVATLQTRINIWFLCNILLNITYLTACVNKIRPVLLTWTFTNSVQFSLTFLSIGLYVKKLSCFDLLLTSYVLGSYLWSIMTVYRFYKQIKLVDELELMDPMSEGEEMTVIVTKT